MSRTPIAVAAAGVAFGIAGLLQSGPAESQEPASVLRAREFVLVDDRGSERASLKVEADGEAILRLRDQTGAIRVKLGANREGSGLLLNNGATEPGIHILSKSRGARLSLKDRGARARTIRAPRAR